MREQVEKTNGVDARENQQVSTEQQRAGGALEVSPVSFVQEQLTNRT